MTLRAGDLVVRVGAVELLRGATLEVRRGEVLAVVGPNGAGKSTLLRALAGDVAPAAGHVSMEGRPLAEWSLAERALRRAVMGHDEELAFAWHVRDVVMLGRIPHHGGDPGPRDHAIVGRLLEDVQMSGFAERVHRTLSSGERQRVGLARALAQLWPADLDPDQSWTPGLVSDGSRGSAAGGAAAGGAGRAAAGGAAAGGAGGAGGAAGGAGGAAPGAGPGGEAAGGGSGAMGGPSAVVTAPAPFVASAAAPDSAVSASAASEQSRWSGRPPAWLLLDEPTANLDLRHQALALELLRARAALGAGVLVVLHDLNLAAAHADRIAIVHHGRVVEIGPPDAVLRTDLLETVFELPMLVVPHPRLPHPLVVPDPSRARLD